MLAYWGVFYCSGDSKSRRGTRQGKTYLKSRRGNQQPSNGLTKRIRTGLKDNGQRAENGWLTVGGKDYYFNEAGKLTTKNVGWPVL